MTPEKGWYVQLDGEFVAGPFVGQNEAFTWLLNHQGQSVAYALEHGGYDFVEVRF